MATTGERLGWGAVAYGFAVAGVVVLTTLGFWPGVGEPGEGFLEHPYRLSMALTSVVLAGSLGFLAGRAGVRTQNPWFGVGALFVGGVLTGIAFLFVPWIRYPNDQYSVAMLWLLVGAPVGVLTWAAVTFGGPRPSDPDEAYA